MRNFWKPGQGCGTGDGKTPAIEYVKPSMFGCSTSGGAVKRSSASTVKVFRSTFVHFSTGGMPISFCLA